MDGVVVAEAMDREATCRFVLLVPGANCKRLCKQIDSLILCEILRAAAILLLVLPYVIQR